MKWIKVLAVNGIVLLFLLAIVEGVFHLVPFKYKILPPLEPRGYSIADPLIGYDITPNFSTSTHSFFDLSYDVWSNSLGCFDREYEGEMPFIYLTGDSFAWGWAPFEKKWATIVEDALGMRVLKCGVNGYGTKQELMKAERVLKELSAKPALVIVGYLGANDFDDDTLFPNYTVENGYRIRSTTLERYPSVLIGLKQWMGANLVIYNLIKTHLYSPLLGVLRKGDRLTTEPVTAIDEAAYERHGAHVLGFKALAEQNNYDLLFVLIPSKSEIKEGRAALNDKLKLLLEKNGIKYVDLFPEMLKVSENESLYWEHDGHWNVRGNEVAGKAVSGYILQNR